MISVADRSLYLREVRKTLSTLLVPELSSARAIDAAACADRILAHLIIVEEQGDALELDFENRVRDVLPMAPTGFQPAVRAAQEFVRTHTLTAAQDLNTLRALINAEHTYISNIVRARNDILKVEVAEQASTTAASISAEQITAYLQRNLIDAPNARVVGLALIPGGRSKETLMLELENAGALTGKVILRKDLPVSLNATLSADEFELLRIMSAAGVPVPTPLLIEADATPLGGTFIIVSCVPGTKKGEIFPDVSFPTEGLHEIGMQLAATLARIHGVPIEQYTAIRPHSALETRESLLRRIDGIHQRFADVVDGEPSVLFELACRWTRDNVDAGLSGPKAILHGDLGMHNMLIEGNTITGMLDWELSSLGYAAADLGAVRHTVRALMPWQEFVDAYVSAGGMPEACDEKAVSFYAMLGCLQGLANTELGGKMFRSGSKRNIVTSNSAADFRYRLAQMLATEMAQIYNSR